MANDYWNKGRRQEGFQQSSSLDTLERLLGIGTNIAGKVQESRDKRQNYNIQWVNSLTSGFESDYNTDSINSMLGSIQDFKKNRIGQMSADTMDLFKIVEDRVTAHKQQIAEYDIQVGGIESLHGLTGGWTETMADYSLLKTKEQKEKFRIDNWGGKSESEKRDEMYGHMIQYGKNISNFFTKHGNRIKNTNPGLFKKYANIQEYMYEALDSWDEDKFISEDEEKLIVNNIDTGLWRPLEDARTRKKSNVEMLDKLYTRQTEDAFTDYNEAKLILERGYHVIGEVKDEFTSGGGTEGQQIIFEVDPADYSKEGAYGKQVLKGKDLDDYNEALERAKGFKLHYVEQLERSWDKLVEMNNYYRGQGLKSPVSEWGIKPPEAREGFEWTEDNVGIWSLNETEPPDVPGTPELTEPDVDKVNVEETLNNISPQYAFSKPTMKRKNIQLNTFKEGIDDIKFGESWENISNFGNNAGLNKSQKKDIWDIRGGAYKGVQELNEMLGNENKKAPISKENIYKLKKEFDKEALSYEKTLEDIRKMEETKASWTNQKNYREVYNNLISSKESFLRKWGWGAHKTTNISDVWRIDQSYRGGMEVMGNAAFALSTALNFYENKLPSILESKEIEFESLRKQVSVK